MAYTASAPINALVKKTGSLIEPITALAPCASIAVFLAGSLLTTVTICPCSHSIPVNGLLIFPSEPVIVNFIVQCFKDAKITVAPGEDLAVLAFDLAENFGTVDVSKANGGMAVTNHRQLK